MIPWSNFCDPQWDICRSKETAVRTPIHEQHGSKIIQVFLWQKALWVLLPRLVSLPSGCTVQPENCSPCGKSDSAGDQPRISIRGKCFCVFFLHQAKLVNLLMLFWCFVCSLIQANSASVSSQHSLHVLYIRRNIFTYSLFLLVYLLLF